jgi:hypothetical protein
VAPQRCRQGGGAIGVAIGSACLRRVGVWARVCAAVVTIVVTARFACPSVQRRGNVLFGALFVLARLLWLEHGQDIWAVHNTRRLCWHRPWSSVSEGVVGAEPAKQLHDLVGLVFP